MERLAYVLVEEGKDKDTGPTFCHEDGSMIESRQMHTEFVNLLERLKFQSGHLFEGTDNIDRDYGVSRSLRRGANTRAKEEGVDETLRDFINQWSSFEAKRGNRPHMSMA